ncbi:MAG: GNAT family N-acetyltransferase [Bacteroidota bacterium]
MKKFESERLYLKKVSVDDMDDRFLSWFQDDDLMKYYTNSRQKITREKILENITEGENSGTSYTYGIFYKENDIIIGTLKLGPITKAHKISDLVILIGDKDYHGKGLAVEAIRLGNRLAFEEYDIRKLYGGMYESNISSIKAYTNAGWIIEGKLKGHYWNNEKNEDRILVGCFNPNYFDINS